MTANPLACPNEPRCPHPGLVHDIEDDADPAPRCCAEGCNCGKRVTQPCGCVMASGVVITASPHCWGHALMETDR